MLRLDYRSETRVAHKLNSNQITVTKLASPQSLARAEVYAARTSIDTLLAKEYFSLRFNMLETFSSPLQMLSLQATQS
jgi:hypothetical protein